MHRCVCSQLCRTHSTSAARNAAGPLALPLGTQPRVGHHRELQDGRHQWLARHQPPPCWRSLGLGPSVRGATQTAKAHMPHKLGSGAGDNNHHYRCFHCPNRAEVPLGTLLARAPACSGLFAKANLKVLFWLPACSPFQQEQREQELLKWGVRRSWDTA